MEYSRSQGNRSPCTQHLRQKLMGQRHPVRPDAVMAGKQPPGKPFPNSVQPVAARMSSSRRFGFPALEHLWCVSLFVVSPLFGPEAICGPIIC